MPKSHNNINIFLVQVGQYIGEICRYLLNTQNCPEEDKHKIRVMIGNGLRPQIWSAFVKRFKIPNIASVYGVEVTLQLKIITSFIEIN